MSEYLISGVIIAAAVWFFYRDRIKKRFFPDQPQKLTTDQQFNADKREREKETHRLLSKMGNNGIRDLSAKDRKRLAELSKK